MTGGGHSSEEKVESLPPNFTFSTEDPFYYGVATCELLHYRTAGLIAAGVEFVMLLMGSFVFWQFYHVNQSLDRWMMLAMLGLFGFSIVTSVIMAYGIFAENSRLVFPKMAFIQIEIVILMLVAFISITAMSVGIEMTNALFGIFIRVAEMERDFGPIWPFAIGVVAFFAAAVCIWMHVLVRGAYDYILDKDFFQTSSSIELSKTLPRED